MTFLFVKVGNSQWQHCLPCREAPIYQIWAQYHKVWCRYGHDLGHLAWNPRMFIHGRPYCEASFFKTIQNSCLAFFMETSSRKRTPCTSFSFFHFSLFSWIFLKLGEICGHANLLLDVESFKNLGDFRYIDYLGTLKWFLAKFKSNLSCSCCHTPL